MTWHPKFIDGRIEISNSDRTTISLFSTIDSSRVDIKTDYRIQKAWWSKYGISAQTEDGKKILVRCVPSCTLADFWGHDLISPQLGQQLNEHEASINTEYDEVIWWKNDENLNTNEEMLQVKVNIKKQAINEAWRLAEQGNSEAQIYIGDLYRKGIGVAKDDTEAARWYKRAAEQGNAKGQVLIGSMYENGRGVEKNLAIAAEWYLKAAEQGNAKGQVLIGSMYENGRGVEKNLAIAAEWYLKAAEQGDRVGMCFLGTMFFFGEGVEKDHRRAFELYKNSAEQGFAKAQFKLGYMYKNGIGVSQNIDEAISWFQKSASQGFRAAKEMLEKMKNE